MTIEEFHCQWFDSNPYITAQTSGSTGKPKEIRLLKSDMRQSARATNSRFGINSHSVLALPLSLDYIAGKMMAVRAFEADCNLTLLPVSNRLEINRPVDLLSIVPSQAESMIADVDPALLSNVIVGGAALPGDLARRLASMPYKVYCSYGMTETCSHVALAGVTGDEPLYTAMPGIQFSCDCRGCLVVESSAMSFGRLVTNDIVELLSPDSFRWLGRADNVINSGGIKIMAEELERQLSEFIPVPYYIVGVADGKWGEVPLLVAEGPAEMAGELLSKIMLSGIDRRQLPRRLEMVESLPRTSNGKLRRINPMI